MGKQAIHLEFDGWEEEQEEEEEEEEKQPFGFALGPKQKQGKAFGF